MTSFLGDVLFYLVAILGVLGACAALAYAFGWLKTFKVEEKTDTEFEFAGPWCFSAMRLKGYHYEADGFIHPGPGRKTNGSCWCIWPLWGGLILYLALLVEPKDYNSNNDADGFGEGHRIFLSDNAKELILNGAKTNQNIPMDIRAIFKMRVLGPYQFQFNSPRDAVLQTIKIMEGVFRNLVVTLTDKQVQELKSNGGSTTLWAAIMAISGNAISIGKLYADWGIYIDPDSVTITHADFQEADQKVEEAKRIQAMQARADFMATAKFIDGLVASKLGFASVKALKEKIKADPKFVKTPEYKEAREYAEDRERRNHAAQHGELSDQRIGSTKGGKFKGNILFGGGRKN